MKLKLTLNNRGYLRALQEIAKIMASKEVVELYREYLEETEGDKMAAAILALASIRQQTEKAIEKAVEDVPVVGSFGSIDHGG
jgi:hypothetical protein